MEKRRIILFSFILFIVVILLVFFVIKILNKPAPITLVTLEIKPPFNNAKIEINNSGGLYFEEKDKLGNIVKNNTKYISLNQYEGISKMIDKSGFRKWNLEYRDKTWLDGTTYTLSVKRGEEVKSVSCYGDSPMGFFEVERTIEGLYGNKIFAVGV